MEYADLTFRLKLLGVTLTWLSGEFSLIKYMGESAKIQNLVISNKQFLILWGRKRVPEKLALHILETAGGL